MIKREREKEPKTLEDRMKDLVLEWLGDLRGNRKLSVLFDVKKLDENRVTIEFELPED